MFSDRQVRMTQRGRKDKPTDLRETEDDQQKYPVRRHIRLLAALHVQPLGITATAGAPLDTQATPN